MKRGEKERARQKCKGVWQGKGGREGRVDRVRRSCWLKHRQTAAVGTIRSRCSCHKLARNPDKKAPPKAPFRPRLSSPLSSSAPSRSAKNRDRESASFSRAVIAQVQFHEMLSRNRNNQPEWALFNLRYFDPLQIASTTRFLVKEKSHER